MAKTRRADKQVSNADAVQFMEVGATGLDFSGGMVYEEFLAQLMHTRGRRIFKEMANNDAVVGAVLYAVEMLIRGVPWSVETEDDTPEGEDRAYFLESVKDDMSHPWSSVIGEWMAAPVYGFAPFEIVYKRRMGASNDPTQRSRYKDGRIGVRKLAIRHPDTLDHWDIDASGGVRAMVQRAAPTYTPRAIPIEKMLLFTVGQQKNNPEGTSLLRRAYTAWYRKKGVEQIEAIGIERELAGLPVFYVPPQWMSANPNTNDAAALAYVQRMGRRLRSDEQACVVLPAMYDNEKNPLVKFELATSGGRRAVDTAQTKEYYSRQIAMTILADMIMLGHEGVGSFALSSSKTNLFSAGLAALLGGIADTLNRYLVPRLWALNGWPTDERMPRFVHGDLENVNLDDLGKYIANLGAAGMPLFPTETGELERELLRAANLPADSVAMPRVPLMGDEDEADMDEMPDMAA